jgi:hypothetical protein
VRQEKDVASLMEEEERENREMELLGMCDVFLAK